MKYSLECVFVYSFVFPNVAYFCHKLVAFLCEDVCEFDLNTL